MHSTNTPKILAEILISDFPEVKYILFGYFFSVINALTQSNGELLHTSKPTSVMSQCISLSTMRAASGSQSKLCSTVACVLPSPIATSLYFPLPSRYTIH